MRATSLLLLSVLVCVACSDDGSGSGAGGEGGSGAGPATTTSAQTSATTNTSTTTVASTTVSTSSTGTGGTGGSGGAGGGDPLDGYGALSGTCGDVDLADILSTDPDYQTNGIDFTARLPFDDMFLSDGGLEMVADGNLGGSSLYSEVFAFEVLQRCEGALLLKTEGEIIYQTMGKKTDILLEIDGERVGVSVVRAMSYPEGSPYPVSQAYDVLEGKLADILESSVNVAPADSWPKQILAVVAQTQDHADAIEQAYAMMDAATKSDTIVYVTVTEGDDDFIYYE